MIGAPPVGIIGERCYCDLGRGGAERSECPPVGLRRTASRFPTLRRGFCSDVACRVAVLNVPPRDSKRAAPFTCGLPGS